MNVPNEFVVRLLEALESHRCDPELERRASYGLEASCHVCTITNELRRLIGANELRRLIEVEEAKWRELFEWMK